ncbi:MAG: AAA family ATPase [Nocardioides sp.]
MQFTPDLMPGDITGSMVTIDSHAGSRRFARARSSPTCCWPTRSTAPAQDPVGAARAMEEGQASVDGVSLPLPRPFLVAATQNPVEYEGTYPPSRHSWTASC